MSSKEEVIRRLAEVEEKVDGELIRLREKLKVTEGALKRTVEGMASISDGKRQLEEEVKKVNEEKSGWEEQVVRLQEQRDEVRKENEMLQTQMKGFAGFRDALYSLVGDIIDTALVGKESKIVAQVSEEVAAMKGGKLSGISVEVEDLKVSIRHKEKVEQITTSTASGRIMYVILKEFEGKPSTMQMILNACREHGWIINPNTFSAEIGKLVRDGKLVKEDTKPLRWRTPGKVIFNVED